jgi:hypothetical protein
VDFLRRFVSVVLLAVVMAAGSVLVSAGPAGAQDLNFTTPSKNIDCLMYEFENQVQKVEEVFVSCLVKNGTWKTKPVKPADCDLDWADSEIGLSIVGGGAKAKVEVNVGACRGDIGPLCGPGCTVLPYGKTAKVGVTSCTSAASGVTCRACIGKRKGFTVNKSGYKIF